MPKKHKTAVLTSIAIQKHLTNLSQKSLLGWRSKLIHSTAVKVAGKGSYGQLCVFEGTNQRATCLSCLPICTSKFYASTVEKTFQHSNVTQMASDASFWTLTTPSHNRICWVCVGVKCSTSERRHPKKHETAVLTSIAIQKQPTNLAQNSLVGISRQMTPSLLWKSIAIGLLCVASYLKNKFR